MCILKKKIKHVNFLNSLTVFTKWSFWTLVKYIHTMISNNRKLIVLSLSLSQGVLGGMLWLNENKYRPALAPPAPRCRWDITDPRPPRLGTWWCRTPWHITRILWYLKWSRQEESVVRTHLQPIASETEMHEKNWKYNRMKQKTYSFCWPFLTEH